MTTSIGTRHTLAIALVTLVGCTSCASMPVSTMPPLTALTGPAPLPCTNSPDDVTCKFLTGKPRVVKAPTADVAYQVFGHGEPLVLIHGWPLNRYTWRNLLPYLVDHFTVYLIDLPGAGDTVWTEETDFTWPGQGRTMKAVIEGLQLSRYYVFAQDSGAVIARELALLDGPRIIKLAMANTEVPDHRPPQALVDTQAKMSKRPHALIDWILRRKLDDAKFLQTPEGFGDSFYDPTFVLGDFRRYILKPIANDAARSEGQRRFLEGWNWKELDSLKVRHHGIKMPVLFIWGEDDRTFPVSQAEEMKEQFPQCVGIVRIPKAKLLVHEERPKEVSDALIEFFRTP